jgi:hypothetical protein
LRFSSKEYSTTYEGISMTSGSSRGNQADLNPNAESMIGNATQPPVKRGLIGGDGYVNEKLRGIQGIGVRGVGKGQGKGGAGGTPGAHAGGSTAKSVTGVSFMRHGLDRIKKKQAARHPCKMDSYEHGGAGAGAGENLGQRDAAFAAKYIWWSKKYPGFSECAPPPREPPQIQAMGQLHRTIHDIFDAR